MKFIFDLDGTITKTETLPVVAQHFGVLEKIEHLTQETISGHVPFVDSFVRRVSILGKYSVSQTRDVLSGIETFASVTAFIEQNSDACVIATGNLDVWVEGLCNQIKCQHFMSEAVVKDNKISEISKILRKEDIVQKFQAEGEQVVYIGDGHNDAEAMRMADFAIASGLVHRPAGSVLEASDCAVFDEAALVRLLEQLKGTGAGINQSRHVLKTQASASGLV